jgi:hypothetical protein
VTGFDIFDRYDVALSLLIGVLMVGALALGAHLWAAAVIVIVGWTGMFIRHLDELTRD